MTSYTKPLKNATDAYVTSRRPNLNKSTQSRIWVSGGADGNTQQGFMFFTMPFPMGAQVPTANLILQSANAVTGTLTVVIEAVTAQWKAGKLNWNNRPAITATNSVSVTKTNPGVGTVWQFNLQPMIQAASTSGVWWGFRIRTSNDPPIQFYSAQANSDLRPELDITWTDAPEPPDELSPAGGRAVSVTKPILSFNFTDVAGNTEINAMQVHYKATNTGWTAAAGFSSPSWDSGTQSVSSPSLDTNTVVGAPALTGTVTYWTVRVQDGSGVWSQWSDPESMKYIAQPTVTLDNPPNATPSVVNDATPPVLWTITGGTQSAYKVIVTAKDDPTKILWNSGKVSTTLDDTAIPAGILKGHSADNYFYHIDVYIWDNNASQREKNGSNPIYVLLSRDFQFDPGATAAVSSASAAQVTPYPWVDVSFSRSSAPDEFNIYRDTELIDSVLASSVSIGGTNYKYRDKTPSPRVSHTWSVQAVVNQVTGPKVATGAVTTRLLAPLMMELDGTNPIYFLNPNVDPQSLNIQEVQQPVNAPPVLVTQYQGGYQGHLDGVLSDGVLTGVTARAMRDIFKKWKRHAGDTYYLYLVDEVLQIVPYNMTYKPRAVTEGILYDVSFDFFEDN